MVPLQATDGKEDWPSYGGVGWTCSGKHKTEMFM